MPILEGRHYAQYPCFDDVLSYKHICSSGSLESNKTQELIPWNQKSFSLKIDNCPICYRKGGQLHQIAGFAIKNAEMKMGWS